MTELSITQELRTAAGTRPGVAQAGFVTVSASLLEYAAARLEQVEGERDALLQPWPGGLPKDVGGVSVGGHYLAGAKAAVEAVLSWHHSHSSIDAVRTQLRHNREAWGKAESQIAARDATIARLVGALEKLKDRYAVEATHSDHTPHCAVCELVAEIEAALSSVQPVGEGEERPCCPDCGEELSGPLQDHQCAEIPSKDQDQ